MHKNANGQVHVFPCFSLFDVPFRSPFILLPVFFGFEVSLFEFPCGFLFLACFSSLKIIRISYSGEHKTRQDHSISTLYIMYIYIYIYRLMYFYTENVMSPFNPAFSSCNAGNLEETHPTFALGVVGNDTSTESTWKAETSFLWNGCFCDKYGYPLVI